MILISRCKQEEAVAENMKNILLVMSSGGYLVPPNEKPQQEELWNETWKRLDRFLPSLFAELFPEEVKKPRRSGSTKEKRISQEKQKEKEEKEEKEENVDGEAAKDAS
jgi:brefeldin A-resistance guanine nucleotide exchange factor 1